MLKKQSTEMKKTNRQTYRYSGPEAYHALVGQVLAARGYVGGHEENHIGAQVALVQQGDRFHLSCQFQGERGPWKNEAVIGSKAHVREALKECLLHWHDRYSGNTMSPWGTLIGVRPTKLVHRLFDEGMNKEQAAAHLCTKYAVSPQKAADLVEMTLVQRPFVMNGARDISLYIGIPYCPSHCVYCSFPSRLIGTERRDDLTAFGAALEKDITDIAALCRQYDLRVRSIYVGGGTPTCLPISLLGHMLETVHSLFPGTVEYTVEAGRPDTATPEVLAMLRDCGVNRISVNPQTMQQRLLDTMGRQHTVEDIYRMYAACKQMAFSVVNMDFIAGLPKQTVEDMRENMEIVCKLHPENVTIHTLALKKRAPLFHHALREEIPGEDEVMEMIALCHEQLQGAGYIPYYMYRQKYMAASFENVGYALPGTISAYNIEMMEERQTVLAAGPGSATKFVCPGGHSLEKVYMPKDIAPYIQGIDSKINQRRHVCAMIYGGEDL